MQGFGVVAEHGLHHPQPILGVQRPHLLQLLEHLVQAAELTLAVGEVELDAGFAHGADLVDIGHTAGVHGLLEHLAQRIARLLALHAHLVEHDQQRREHLGRFQPAHAQHIHCRRQLHEPRQHVVGIDAQVERTLDGVRQPDHVAFAGARGVLQLGSELGGLGVWEL